ncbi:MAG: redoxin domain-containing protein [Clostridiales bacterium]|nr:redoxin domain-containing protein [Clostridiales bacterium]
MRGKIILPAIGLLVLIIGSSVLYSALADRVSPPDPFEASGAASGAASGQASAATDSPSAEEDKKEERIPAPDFIVQDAEGNPVALSDLAGNPVVLNFWASWCPPCRSEMPEFNRVYEELGDTVQFMMINAVGSRGETKEDGLRYIAEEAFTFPVYFDMEQEAVIEYGIRAFPTSIFIDAEGYVVAGVEGAINEETLKRGITMISNPDQGAQSAAYRKIKPEEAKGIMEDGRAYILLDVRSNTEYEASHIDGAILLPHDEIAARASAVLPDKDARILIYCYSGVRSADAAKALVALGYTGIYDFGGITDWPYEMVSS